MPASTILLFEDETIIRLFPGLRRGWSMKGEQALVHDTCQMDAKEKLALSSGQKVCYLSAVDEKSGNC